MFVIGKESFAPEHPEDAGPHPLLEAAMSRGAGADAGAFQGVPLHACSQDQQDGVHGVPIGNARAVATKRVMVHRLGNQRLHHHPKLIGHAPAIVLNHESHDGLLLLKRRRHGR
jgi:hypothetical protein